MVIVVLQGCIIALVNYFCKHPLSAMGSRHSKKGNVNLKVESTYYLLAGINFNNFFKGLITWRISARAEHFLN